MTPHKVHPAAKAEVRGAYRHYKGASPGLLAQAKRLPPPERLELIAALWDTFDAEELPVTAEESQVLEARMADVTANPSAEESWSDAQAWLESRRR